MKNLISSSVAIALSVFTFTAQAENVDRSFTVEGTNIKITAIENAKTVMVSLNNTATGALTIALEDAAGTHYADETVKSSAHFAKKYNLSQLETGKYRFVIVKNALKTVQPFELTSTNIVLNELERKEKFLPVVAQNGNKMDVNVLLGNYSNIIVRVYDSEGKLAFSDKNYVVLTLHKRYDLSSLAKGMYIVEVLAGDETQNFTVNL